MYQDNADRMYRFAQRLCGEEEDARDLVQETFLNAYRGLRHFRGEAQFATWLYRIASRACLAMRRRRKGEPEHELPRGNYSYRFGPTVSLRKRR